MEDISRRLRVRRRHQPSFFFRHVLTLVTGNVAAQLLLLGAIPVLTRLYQPSEMGIQALFFALVAIASIVAAGRFPMAIVQASTEREALCIMRLSFLLVLASGTLVALASAWAGPVALVRFGRPDLFCCLWCLPAAIILAGIEQICSFWTIRNRRFRLQALARVAAAVAVTGVQILLGLLGEPHARNLVIGLVAGRLAAVCVFAMHACRYDRPTLRTPMSSTELAATAKRHRQFPLYSLPGSLLNESVSDIPTFLLTHQYGPAVVGLFSMARKGLGMPISLIAEAVGQVTHQRIAAARQAGQPGHIVVLGVFCFLIALIALPMSLLLLCGPWLFSIVLGEKWADSGFFARALVPMFAMKFAVQPITRVFLVYERQLGGLLWQAAFFALSLGALAISSSILNDPVRAVFAYSLVGATMYATILLLSVYWSGGTWQTTLSGLMVAVRARFLSEDNPPPGNTR